MFDGKLAFVGGGSRSIGLAIARRPTMNGANFSKALADKGLRDDINVNLIHPGLTVTERLDRFFDDRAAQQGKNRDQIEAGSIAAEGIRRLGHPEDVAALAIFHCSPGARHNRGTGISCGGGESKG